MSYASWQMEKYGNVLPDTHILPPDERTDYEIQQDQFEKWQQQYEYERENQQSNNNES